MVAAGFNETECVMQPNPKHESNVDWSLVAMAVTITASLVFLFSQFH
jgi:hypothetical protein